MCFLTDELSNNPATISYDEIRKSISSETLKRIRIEKKDMLTLTEVTGM